MIRLELHGIEERIRAGLAARLRGCTFSTGLDAGRTEEHSLAPDAVVIAGRPLPDIPTLENLLRAGKHLLLASEPWFSLAELEALQRSADQAGVRLAVVNPERYLPSRQFIRQQLAGPLGEVGLIRLHCWEAASTEPPPEPLGLPVALIRALDVTLWLSGRRPDRVFALERPAEPGPGAGRFLQVHLGFPGGGMALLDFCNRLPPGEGYQSLSVIAFSGAAQADDHQNMQLAYRGGRPQAIRTEEGETALVGLIQEFVTALGEDRTLGSAAIAWREVFTVIGAVKSSLAAGQAVPLENR
jgi:predicted dehydrogenase